MHRGGFYEFQDQYTWIRSIRLASEVPEAERTATLNDLVNRIHQEAEIGSLEHTGDGTVVRRAGVMAVVRRGGEVRPGDPVTVVLPPTPHRALDPV